MATITNLSPANGSTGAGYVLVGNLRVIVEYRIGDSSEPWGAGDCIGREFYLNGVYKSQTSGWCPSGDYGYTHAGLAYNTTYTWRVDIIVDDTGNVPTWYRVTGDTWSFTTITEPGPPEQPITPTPTDTQSGFTYDDELAWVDGGLGGNSEADTYDVYVGNAGGLTSVSLAQEANSYSLTDEDKALFYDAICYWRIDASNALGDTEGNVWTFDARPSKAITPTPGNASTDIITSFPSLTWVTGGYTTTYDLYFGLTSGALSEVGLGFVPITYGMPSVLGYIKTYYWRVDATNSYGTQTGTEWSFTTMQFKPPGITGYYGGEYYQLLVLEDGVLGQPPPDGVENTDYIVVSYLPNFISTTKRLVCAAANKIWMEY